MKRTKHHTFKPLFPEENAYPMYAGNQNQELVKKKIIRVLDQKLTTLEVHSDLSSKNCNQNN